MDIIKKQNPYGNFLFINNDLIDTTKPDKFAVIYHNKDMDGIVSGWLMKNYLASEYDTDNIVMIGYNYESDITVSINNTEDISLSELFKIGIINKLYFVDITPNQKFYQCYLDYHNNETELNIFDHHINRIETIVNIWSDLKIQKKNDTIYNINTETESYVISDNLYDKNIRIVSEKPDVEEHKPISAAQIIYSTLLNRTFNRNKKISNIFINLISDYDTYRFAETNDLDSLYFDYYLRNLNITDTQLYSVFNIINYLLLGPDKEIYLKQYLTIGEDIFVRKHKNCLIDTVMYDTVSENIKFVWVDGKSEIDYATYDYTDKFLQQHYPDKPLIILFYKVGAKSISVRNTTSCKKFNQGFMETDYDYHCGFVAQQLSDEGGGHFGAAGFKLDKTYSNPVSLQNYLNRLISDTPL